MRDSAAIVIRSGRALAATLVMLAVLAGALAACSPRPAADALEGPAKSVSAAVRATTLAVDLRSSDRTTAAAGTTVADDMLGEVESAIDEVESIALIQEERGLRDDMLAAFSVVARSILHARDAMTVPSGESGIKQPGQLPEILGELRRADDQLHTLMAKAGIR
ncbi:hypothetical protein ACIQC5_12900 [Paenarthrobacter sp. NPDC092416]|uniref:hypothetical protein n=1 Tax=Paenarthrobacter sp. NPDC092416 TaxID=3364386 RepID=UPI003826D990